MPGKVIQNSVPKQLRSQASSLGVSILTRRSSTSPTPPSPSKLRPPCWLSRKRAKVTPGLAVAGTRNGSVWVPFTSESKEAIASYPEVTKELRLGLQAVGRKLAMYLNQRKRVKQEGERREIFLRYLGEVATAVSSIKGYGDGRKKDLYGQLLGVAKRKTAVADTQLDDRGKKKAEPVAEDFGENVLIVDAEQHGQEN